MDIITWEQIAIIIGITTTMSTLISKLFMRYLDNRINSLYCTIEERKDDCSQLNERMKSVEDYHIETKVSLAQIGKDIEYIKQENNKMAVNIEKILNNNCRK